MGYLASHALLQYRGWWKLFHGHWKECCVGLDLTFISGRDWLRRKWIRVCALYQSGSFDCIFSFIILLLKKQMTWNATNGLESRCTICSLQKLHTSYLALGCWHNSTKHYYIFWFYRFAFKQASIWILTVLTLQKLHPSSLALDGWQNSEFGVSKPFQVTQYSFAFALVLLFFSTNQYWKEWLDGGCKENLDIC